MYKKAAQEVKNIPSTFQAHLALKWKVSCIHQKKGAAIC